MKGLVKMNNSLQIGNFEAHIFLRPCANAFYGYLTAPKTILVSCRTTLSEFCCIVCRRSKQELLKSNIKLRVCVVKNMLG